ncbi:MAG: hypothetical protein LRS43_03745 [Desulfurococcales archaeon]|nr:hypothetical protein [Desulfurococcales archaeon]
MRGRLQHRLRELPVIAPPRVASHVSYIVERNSGVYLGIALGASLPLAIFMTLVFPPQIDLLILLVVFMSFIISILAGFMASAAAGEIESGETLLYLSTPLSKAEYYYSWIFSTTVMFTAIYSLGFVVPLIVVSPRSIATLEISGALIAVTLQLLYHTVIFSSAAVTLKSRTRVIGFITGFLLILPVSSLIVLALLEAVSDIYISDEAFVWIFGLYYPSFIFFFKEPNMTTGNLAQEAMLVLTVFAALFIASRRYVKRRMEV